MEWIVSLTDAVASDPLEAVSSPPEGATLVELRGDLLPELDPAEAIARCPLPILYTLRSTDEGGRGPVDPALRRSRFTRARDAGVALFDLEALRDRELVRTLGLNPAQIILSWHDPVTCPVDLEARIQKLMEVPAGLLKVVATPRSLDDLEFLLTLQKRLNRNHHRRRLLAFGMGPFGLPTRYLSPLLGPHLAYAAWSSRTPAAPGQVALDRLQQTIGHLVGPPRRLFAVVGEDVSASLSPVLHGAGFAVADLHSLMIPMSISNVADLARLFVPAGRDLFSRSIQIGLEGMAVTTPWKAHALKAATLASPRARRAGAANTLIPGPDRILADNTDADGVCGALRNAGFDPAGLVALVQGTGGAGRGAAVGLDLAGCDVRMRGRSHAHTRAVAEQLGVAAMDSSQSPPPGSILVNATPLGGGDEDPLPFSREEIRQASVVLDMVYNLDRATALATACSQADTHFIGGIEMLLHQGLAQFAAMTGVIPPRNAMASGLRRFSRDPL